MTRNVKDVEAALGDSIHIWADVEDADNYYTLCGWLHPSEYVTTGGWRASAPIRAEAEFYTSNVTCQECLRIHNDKKR